MKVNYTKHLDEIVSITKIPFDETKPYIEMTENEYQIFVTSRAIANIRLTLEEHPQLEKYFKDTIDALETKLNEL